MRELVIKIPDSVYQKVKDGEADEFTSAYVVGAVSDGITLPKGHNRLIETTEDLYQEIRKWCGGDMAYEIITNAPTIIEADKENKND